MTGDWQAGLAGRTLSGRYTIREPIGSGGMSVVFRALDTTLGRDVAVKIIIATAPGPARQRLRERFRREAAAAAGIGSHPNLVHIYDYGTDPEQDLDFIVMELLPGRDLKAVLASGGLQPAQSLRVLLESARGLAAGHGAGLVHRDIKPANIFLVGDLQVESVRLLDFGIAKPVDVDDDLTLTGEAPPHSPAYASPEQLRHGGTLTPASDVFQLGLVAYEMLAGERPFTLDERDRLRSGEPVPLPVRGRWSTVPLPVRQIVERCLALDPRARFADAAEFAEAVAAAPTAASGPSAGPRPPAAAPPPEDDHTLFDGSGTWTAPPPSGPVGVSVRSGAPPRDGDGRVPRWNRRSTVGLVVAALLLMLGAGWMAARAAGRSAEPAATLDFAALDRVFRDLQLEAARGPAAEPAPGEGADPVAAEAVARVIEDVYRSWTDGDLERFGSHYAPRVDFHGRSRVRRASVVRERTTDRDRFVEVMVTIERQAIEFPEPDRARALVDRSWELRGPEIQWDGAARQQLVLERRNGRWLITGEDEVEVYRSDCTGC